MFRIMVDRTGTLASKVFCSLFSLIIIEREREKERQRERKRERKRGKATEMKRERERVRVLGENILVPIRGYLHECTFQFCVILIFFFIYLGRTVGTYGNNSGRFSGTPGVHGS